MYKIESTTGYRDGFEDGLRGIFDDLPRKGYCLNTIYAQEYDMGFEAGLKERDRRPKRTRSLHVLDD